MPAFRRKKWLIGNISNHDGDCLGRPIMIGFYGAVYIEEGRSYKKDHASRRIPANSHALCVSFTLAG